MATPVLDLAQAYFKDALDHGGMSEFSVDDWQRINHAVKDHFAPSELVLLAAYDFLNTEFTRGHRCAVCGRTEAQSAAIGYDCAREC